MQDELPFILDPEMGKTLSVRPDEVALIRSGVALTSGCFSNRSRRKARNGEYWPFAGGGPLDKETVFNKQGPPDEYGLFAIGVMKYAQSVMSPHVFNIFCEFQGCKPAVVREKLLYYKEVYGDCKVRNRSILRRLGQGCTIEAAQREVGKGIAPTAGPTTAPTRGEARKRKRR